MRFPIILLLQLLGGAGGAVQRLRLAWRLLRDPRVPLPPKGIPLLSVAYLVSPLDFLPDWFLAVGHMDDLSVMILGLLAFIWACPPRLVQEHQRLMAGSPADDPARGAPPGTSSPDEVIDVEARVIDGKKSQR